MHIKNLLISLSLDNLVFYPILIKRIKIYRQQKNEQMISDSIGCYVRFLGLLQQMTTNLVNEDNKNVFSCSSGGQKVKMKASVEPHTL